VLTRREILRHLKNEDVYLGKDPDRTFSLYQEKGLLPKPQGFRRNEPLYPDHTPRVIKGILFAQQVEKRTIDEIVRERLSGSEIQAEALMRLGLEEPPLNFYTKHVHHGKFGSPDSDILVAIYKTHIVIFLLVGLWGGFFHSPHTAPKPLRVLKKFVLSMEQYGDYVSHQAIRRITAEGTLLEETYLFEALLG